MATHTVESHKWICDQCGKEHLTENIDLPLGWVRLSIENDRGGVGFELCSKACAVKQVKASA